MRVIYHIVIVLYWLSARFLALFSRKAADFVSGRRNLLEKIRHGISSGNPIVWFHCASVGEFEQARPLIEMIRKRAPEYRILLTFFSPSGYELRKNYDKADWVFYMPVDTPGNAAAFLDAVRPVKAIFIKYEFWYGYLKELEKRGTDTYIVSAIFRPSQYFFRWYGFFSKAILRSYRHIFVQDKGSETLLRKIGAERITVCGDTRFDRVYEIVKAPKDLPVVRCFRGRALSLVAGSTWPPDTDIIVASVRDAVADGLIRFSSSEGGFKMVIAPHEIKPGAIAALISGLESSGISCARYSSFAGFDGSDAEAARRLEESGVLIIDNVGILSSVYAHADMAYIGGGFGVGIHNILEAAAYSIPVIFGPNYRKFREAVTMAGDGSAFPVRNRKEFDSIFLKLCGNESFRLSCGEKASVYVKSNLGATATVFENIFRN